MLETFFMTLSIHFGDNILFLIWCDLCFLAVVCVVRVEGTPYLCQTDEVGEICVSSGSTGVAYFGLPGMTKNIFEVSVSFFLTRENLLLYFF